jgi:carboxyl-terminal processing protease
MHKFIRHAIIAISAIACLFCQRPTLPSSQPTLSKLSIEQKQLLLDSFEVVWTTVRDKHYDPKLGGLDWQEVYAKFKPRIQAAVSDTEGRIILNEMLGLLKQTHIAVTPASAYNDLHGGSRGDFSPGIDIRILDGRAIVVGAEIGSPAEAAGISPGWELLSVGNRALAPTLKAIEENFTNSTLKGLMGARMATDMLSGRQNEPVEAKFHSGTETKTLTLGRVAPRGEKVTFGNMPSVYFWAETAKTEDDIRIIKFNIWFNPEAVAKAFSEILTDSRDAKGFIVDLRGNPGGIGFMATGAAGWFTSQKGLKLGTMPMRDGTLNFVVMPRPNATDRPLAILVDDCSGSTTEIFAGGMQDLSRARIFGSRTAGAALPSTFMRLPNGDGFQYIVANYISEGGRQLEGLGVTPDEAIAPTQADLLAGKDPALDRAIQWIRELQ